MEGHKEKEVPPVGRFCDDVWTDEVLERLDVDALQENRDLEVTRTLLLFCDGYAEFLLIVL